MIYMITAFVWWAILLIKKNEEIYYTKTALAKMEQQFLEIEDRTLSQEIINQERSGQRLMIWGEGAVFTLTLLIGIWLINSAHHREIATSKQQRNFLLSITHELKSPIASIRLALDTFLKRELNNGQIMKLSTGALQETERLNGMVNDLLLSAKMENRYELNLVSINLSELVDQQILLFSKMHPNVNFKQKSQNSSILLRGDQQGISLVISNLFENAIKYNFSNHKELIINILQENKKIIIEISDNGNGIPEKDKNKIFDKFFRAGNEETRKTKGTGLGLYIVKEIVKSHSGKIEVKPNAPKGTIFKVSLPKLQA